MKEEIEAEEIRKVLLDAVEFERRKQIFEILNAAYDLAIDYVKKQNMDRDLVKKYFSGIADDYKMAELRYSVAKDEREAARSES